MLIWLSMRSLSGCFDGSGDAWRLTGIFSPASISVCWFVMQSMWMISRSSVDSGEELPIAIPRTFVWSVVLSVVNLTTLVESSWLIWNCDLGVDRAEGSF